MAYVKRLWKGFPSRETPITAAALNNLETQYEQMAADIADPESPVGSQLSATIAAQAGGKTVRQDLAWREFFMQAMSVGGALQQCGDSTTAGVNATEDTASPTVLEQTLLDAGVWLGGDGFSHPYPSSVPTDRWSFTGTWTFDPASMGKQIGGKGEASATATYAAVRPSTSVAVLAYGGAGTGFTVEVDGVEKGTLSTPGAAGIRSLVVTGLANIAHTVKVTALSATGILCGVSTHGTGLVIDNLGRSGISTSGWLAAPDGMRAVADHLVSIRPGGVTARTVALGINDCMRALPPSSNGTTLTDFKANLTDIVAWAKTAGPVAVQTLLPVGAAPRDLSYREYGDAVLRVAAAAGCLTLDIFSRWVTYAAGRRAGYFGADTVHPVAAGYADVAAAWQETLLPDVLHGAPAAPETGFPVAGATRRYVADTSMPAVVDAWPDLIGGVTLTQATEAARPALVSEGGKPALEFTAKNLAGPGMSATQRSIMVVARQVTDVANKNLFAEGGYFFRTSPGGGNFILAGASNVTGAASDTAWHVFTIVIDRTAQTGVLYVDGVKASGALGASSGSGFAIGVSASTGATFRVREVYAFERALTDEEESAARAFLASKWAI